MKSQTSKVKTTRESDSSGKYDAARLGAEDNSRLALVELKLSVASSGGEQAASGAIHAKYHSVLAMEAAKKMRRSRQKLKTGQQVCHHLKMMLTSEPCPNNAVPRDQTAGTAPQFHLGF